MNHHIPHETHGAGNAIVLKPTKHRLPQMPCPACGAKCNIGSSQEASHTLRSIYYQCSDLLCGHTFEAHLTFIRTLSPSAHGEVSKTHRLKRPPPAPLNPPKALPPDSETAA